MLTGTSTSSPSRGPSRTTSRVPSISEEAVSPLPASIGGHHGGRRGATIPVSSLLAALNEGNERTEPETFEASLLLIHHPSCVQLLAALCAWKHTAVCAVMHAAFGGLGVLPLIPFGAFGRAAFHCLWCLWACCLFLPCSCSSMLPSPAGSSAGHQKNLHHPCQVQADGVRLSQPNNQSEAQQAPQAIRS